MNKKHKILVYNTGGTFSCRETKSGLNTEKEFVEDWIEKQEVLRTHKNFRDVDFVYEEGYFFDSSQANVDIWNRLVIGLSNAINIHAPRACILIHGTDTMAYSGSVISFGLTNAKIPIILIGSQYRVEELNSDGPSNFYGAAICAKQLILKGVGDSKFIYFHGNLMMATRVRKVHTSNIDAFETVNCDPVGKVQGNEVHLNETFVKSLKDKVYYQKRMIVKATLPMNLSDKVQLFRINPLFKVETLKQFTGNIIILETYGAGNIPKTLSDYISKKDKKNIYFVCTECYNGQVESKYAATATGSNCISLRDMVPETSLVKASRLMGDPRFINIDWEDNASNNSELRNDFKKLLPKLFVSRIRSLLFTAEKNTVKIFKKYILDNMAESNTTTNTNMTHKTPGVDTADQYVKTLQYGIGQKKQENIGEDLNTIQACEFKQTTEVKKDRIEADMKTMKNQVEKLTQFNQENSDKVKEQIEEIQAEIRTKQQAIENQQKKSELNINVQEFNALIEMRCVREQQLEELIRQRTQLDQLTKKIEKLSQGFGSDQSSKHELEVQYRDRELRSKMHIISIQIKQLEVQNVGKTDDQEEAVDLNTDTQKPDELMKLLLKQQISKLQYHFQMFKTEQNDKLNACLKQITINMEIQRILEELNELSLREDEHSPTEDEHSPREDELSPTEDEHPLYAFLKQHGNQHEYSYGNLTKLLEKLVLTNIDFMKDSVVLPPQLKESLKTDKSLTRNLVGMFTEDENTLWQHITKRVVFQLKMVLSAVGEIVNVESRKCIDRFTSSLF